jgi:hypothetical protein
VSAKFVKLAVRNRNLLPWAPQPDLVPLYDLIFFVCKLNGIIDIQLTESAIGHLASGSNGEYSHATVRIRPAEVSRPTG